MTICQKISAFLWPKHLTNAHKCLENKNPKQKSCLLSIRLTAVIVFIGIFVHSIFALEHDREYYYIAFTQWGLFMTSFTFILLLLCSFTKAPGRFCKTINCLGFVFFEITWTAEVVVTIVFWSILVVVDFDKANDYDIEVIAFMGETHILPIVFLGLEFTNNRMRFTKGHAVIAAIAPTLYTATSIVLALVFNIHAYSILTWKDYKSAIFGVIIMALFCGGFVSGYLLGECKHRRRRHRKMPPLLEVERPNDQTT